MCYTPLWYHSAFPAELMIISFTHFILLEQIQQQWGKMDVNLVGFLRNRGRFHTVPISYQKIPYETGKS